jgi:hypothetical protein
MDLVKKAEHAILNDPPLPGSVDETEDQTTTMKDSPVAAAPPSESRHLLQTGDEITGVPNVNDVVFQRLNGSPGGIDIEDNEVQFSGYCYRSVGAPAALATSGVLYWELGIKETSGFLNVGFALKEGIEQTSVDDARNSIYDAVRHAGCGDSGASWGLDGLRCCKSHNCHSVTWPCKKLTTGDVIGLAANVDTGSIAVSINGIWEGEACGIVFEDDKIKEGVYPCLSFYGDTMTLRWSLKAEDWKHAAPGAGVWTMFNTTPLTLHDAIGWGKGAAVIDAIIKTAHEAVKETGQGRMLPLHWSSLSKNEEAMTRH